MTAYLYFFYAIFFVCKLYSQVCLAKSVASVMPQIQFKGIDPQLICRDPNVVRTSYSCSVSDVKLSISFFASELVYVCTNWISYYRHVT